MVDGGEWEGRTSHHGQLFFSLLSAGRMLGGRSRVQLPKWLTVLETRGLIRPEEVNSSLSWEKRAGDRHSAYTAIETPDKPSRWQGGRNSMPTTSHCGIGRCWEMQPEAQLCNIPPAPPDWQHGGPWPWGAACITGNPESAQSKLRPWNVLRPHCGITQLGHCLSP